MNWIRSLLSRGTLDRDLTDEIRQHLEEKVEELVESGMPIDEAMLTARRHFGNVTRMEERGRDVWRWLPVEEFFTDVRFALRQLRKAPAFALASVLTLALGIGANTVVFSVVNAVLLRPLPYLEPERLVVVRSVDIRGTPHPATLSYPTFFDFRRQNQVFEGIVSSRSTELSLTGKGQPIYVPAQVVSWDLFPMLGVKLALGRGFLPHEEEAGQRTVILSHELWRQQFAGDPAIDGKVIAIDRQPYTVVGVAPPGFAFPPHNRSVQIWTTLGYDAASGTVPPATEQRGARMLASVARLRPGVTVEQAQAQMDVVAASLAREYPDSNKSLPRTLIQPARETLVGDAKGPLLILLGAVGLVLLIACANIANLLLARTSERSREFALRAAIGAGRGRIVRQLVTESFTLAVLGCTAGVLAAMWTIRFAVPLAGNTIPRIHETSLDGSVLGFAVALAVVTSLLFGLAPALRMAGVEFATALKEGSQTIARASDGLRSALCVGQIALGLVLLSGAGLLVVSFLQLMRKDLGLRPEGVITFKVNLPGQDYSRQRQFAFHAELLAKLRDLPGVQSAALATPLPLTGTQMTIAFNIEGRPTGPTERVRAAMAIVTPEYFRTVGTPILEGRDFGERDDENAPPVLVVNRAFANRFFPGERAIGRKIEPGVISASAGPNMREIVGVAENATQSMLKADAEPIYYLPYRQLPWCCPAAVLRSTTPAQIMAPAIRSTVTSLDKQLPVFDIRALTSILSEGVARPRFQMMLLGSFACIALLLTMVGLYGLVSYSVVMRTREIGVRIALGASRQEVLATVLRRAMLLVAAGIAIGLAGAIAVTELMKKMINGTTPQNAMLLTGACFVLAVTGALAAYLPARRAASIDPMLALRGE